MPVSMMSHSKLKTLGPMNIVLTFSICLIGDISGGLLKFICCALHKRLSYVETIFFLKCQFFSPVLLSHWAIDSCDGFLPSYLLV